VGAVAGGIAAAAIVAGVFEMRFVMLAAVAALVAGRWAARVVPAAVGFGALSAAGVLLMLVAPSTFHEETAFVPVFGGLAPWLVGLAWRQSEALVRGGWDRAERLDREQRLATEHARLRERTTIAQDLHDVLGHDLNLVALRAGALKLSPGLSDEHREAADELRRSAAEAVERLGVVVGVLHDGAVDAVAPVDELVERARVSGLDVTLTVDGEAPAAGPLHDRAVRRIVQEALTNVVKHAPGSRAVVRIRYGADDTAVDVVNEPASSVVGDGRGLIGLRERIRIAGGSIDVGPAGAGWRVTARIPYHGGAPAPPPPVPTTSMRGTARRRAVRAVAALLVLPLCTMVAVSVVTWAWAKRSVLDAGVYASLRVGQQRAEFAGFLPRHQFGDPPAGTAPPNASCEYYAVTADRFDDRAGNAYRLCFRDGALISLDILTE
jgi:signal transduction histidine kinase